MKGLSRREFLGTGTLFTAGALTLAGARSALSQEWAGQSEGIYRTLRDPKIISELEMKHVPLIKAPERVKKGEKFEVAVRQAPKGSSLPLAFVQVPFQRSNLSL